MEVLTLAGEISVCKDFAILKLLSHNNVNALIWINISHMEILIDSLSMLNATRLQLFVYGMMWLSEAYLYHILILLWQLINRIKCVKFVSLI